MYDSRISRSSDSEYRPIDIVARAVLRLRCAEVIRIRQQHPAREEVDYRVAVEVRVGKVVGVHTPVVGGERLGGVTHRIAIPNHLRVSLEQADCHLVLVQDNRNLTLEHALNLCLRRRILRETGDGEYEINLEMLPLANYYANSLSQFLNE